jgi:L-asparaginase
MQNINSVVVVLGTGGTIAGTAADSADNLGYTAAQLPAAQLVADVQARAGGPVETHQLAQLDSKDMTHALWWALAQAVQAHLGRADVAGIVITHGTDTLEETAYFLHRVLAPARPVVLVGAMRPASALQADGPQNLLDALRVARTPQARGVLAVLAGTVLSGAEVRKLHPYRLDAFGAGDAGALGRVQEGRLRMLRDWPGGVPIGLAALRGDPDRWPRVEILTSHAGACATTVQALVGAGAAGIVVAGTGNGSVHRALEAALIDAQDAGVAVLRCSRCLDGEVMDATPAPLRSAGALTAVQARIELMLQLMCAPAA